MINEGSIKSYKVKLGDLIKSLDALLVEIEQVEATEEHLRRKSEIILQKEKGLARREVVVAENTSKIGVLKEEQESLIKKREEEDKRLGEVAAKVEARRKSLIAKENIVDEKTTALAKLEEKKKDLDEREEELTKEKESIIQREALVKKEKILARKRKETLDVRESTLKTKQAKLQKFLDLSDSV